MLTLCGPKRAELFPTYLGPCLSGSTAGPGGDVNCSELRMARALGEHDEDACFVQAVRRPAQPAPQGLCVFGESLALTMRIGCGRPPWRSRPLHLWLFCHHIADSGRDRIALDYIFPTASPMYSR